MMKKFINILLCVSISVLMIRTNVISRGVVNQYFSISEIEYINQLQNIGKDQLKSQGYTNEQIDYIYSIDIVKDFKDRAKLPYNVLKEYGYSNTEIIKMKDILKKENLNVVDIIKNALSATLTLSLIGLSTSKSQYVLGFSFSWSSRPFYLYDDLIAFAWEASGVNGIPINAAINTSQSYLTVKYTAVNGSIASNDLNKSITAIQGYHSAKVKFKEGERMLTGTGIYWAYYGTGKIYIDAVVSETIYELLFSIAYGHTIFSIHPSVSISFGDGSAVFDFNTSCNQEAIITKRYGYNGSVTTL